MSMNMETDQSQGLVARGRNAAYSAIPQIDETAARALAFTDRRLNPLLRLGRGALQAGSEVLDIVFPNREDDRLLARGLRRRIGHVAVVGRFDPDGSEAQNRRAADGAAETLWRSRAIFAGRIVGIHALMTEKDYEMESQLQASAEGLRNSIKQKFDLSVGLVAPRDPLVLPGGKPHSRSLHQAIYRGDLEARNLIEDILGMLGYRAKEKPLTSSLFVMDRRLAEGLRGVEPDHLHNGGVAVLKSAGKNPNHYVWHPATPASELPETEVVEETSRETANVSHGNRPAVAVDRENRFIRAYMRQAAERRARERRIGLSEG